MNAETKAAVERCKIVADALVSIVFLRTQPKYGDVFGWVDDHKDEIAAHILTALEASQSASQDQGADEKARDLLWRMAAEYDRDEECDHIKINGMIEEGAELVGFYDEHHRMMGYATHPNPPGGVVEAAQRLLVRWDMFLGRDGWGNQADAYYSLAKGASKDWDALRAALSTGEGVDRG